MTERNEDVLRRILETEAAKVEVQWDALSTIRARTERRARWWPFGTVVLTAATATAATVVVIALLSGGSPQTVAPPEPGAVTGGATAPPATSAPPPTTPAPSPSGSSSSAGTTTASLAIYYVADDRGTPRLYREFRRLPAGDGSPTAKIRAALTEMLDPESADDPDYTSAWPSGVRVRDVSVSGSTATVDVSGAAPTTEARQQLVWTVAAVLGGDPSVRLLVDGQPSGTLRKAAALDTLGRIWLINPQHGETVARTFEVHVAGTAYEATVQLRVRQGDVTVKETFLTLSAGPPARGEAKLTLTLAPGTYTVETYEISADDGSVQHLDDHTVTVR